MSSGRSPCFPRLARSGTVAIAGRRKSNKGSLTDAFFVYHTVFTCSPFSALLTSTQKKQWQLRVPSCCSPLGGGSPGLRQNVVTRIIPFGSGSSPVRNTIHLVVSNEYYLRKSASIHPRRSPPKFGLPAPNPDVGRLNRRVHFFA